MSNYHFSIIVEQDNDGYFVFCPELQGCYSQGETYEEAVQNIKDAIKLHIADRLTNREELPETKSISLSTVEVAIWFMTELPKLTAREIIAALEKAGFIFSRQSGSHKIYKNSKGTRATVPFHDNKILHPKILSSILKDTEIELKDLS